MTPEDRKLLLAISICNDAKPGDRPLGNPGTQQAVDRWTRASRYIENQFDEAFQMPTYSEYCKMVGVR